MRKSAMVAITAMAIGAAFASVGVAGARQRWPILGCDELSESDAPERSSCTPESAPPRD
jgi:hypothetical protein